MASLSRVSCRSLSRDSASSSRTFIRRTLSWVLTSSVRSWGHLWHDILFRFVILGFLDLVTLSTWGGLVCVFLGKWSNSLGRPRRKFGVPWSTPPLFLLYLPRSARSLSALIAPFVPGHYSVLFIFFGLSVFSFAYVFFLAGSS